MLHHVKAILGISLIGIVPLLLLVVSCLGMLRESYEYALRDRAVTLVMERAENIEKRDLTTGSPMLASFVAELLDKPDFIYVRVVNDGIVLAKGGAAEALARPFVVDQRLDRVEDGVFDVALELAIAGYPHGRIEVGLTPAIVQQALRSAHSEMLGYAGLAFGITLVLALLLVIGLRRYLLTPFMTLANEAGIESSVVGPQPSSKWSCVSGISSAVYGANIASEERESLKVYARVSQILQTQRPLKKRLQAVLACLTRVTGVALRNKACILFYRQAAASLDPFLTHPACDWQSTPTAQHFTYLYSLSMTPPGAGEILLSDISPFLPDRVDAHRFGHYAIPIRHNDILFGMLFFLTKSSPRRSHSRLIMLRLIGEMLGFAIAHDQLQQELTMLRKVAGEMAEVKFHFWANVNHEIRTPMNGVLGMLDLLDDTELAPTQREHLKTAYRSAKRLLKVIDDVLDFSKPETSKRCKGGVNLHLTKVYQASPPC